MFSAIHNLSSRDHHTSHRMLPSMPRKGASRCRPNELELWSSRSKSGKKDQTAKLVTSHKKKPRKPCQNGRRPRMSDPQATTTAINSRVTEHRPLFGCVRGVLRSKRPSSAGRHGRIAGDVMSGYCVYGGRELHIHSCQNVVCGTTTVRDSAAPREKPKEGTIDWHHDATHIFLYILFIYLYIYTPGTCRLARDAALPPF